MDFDRPGKVEDRFAKAKADKYIRRDGTALDLSASPDAVNQVPEPVVIVGQFILTHGSARPDRRGDVSSIDALRALGQSVGISPDVIAKAVMARRDRPL